LPDVRHGQEFDMGFPFFQAQAQGVEVVWDQLFAPGLLERVFQILDNKKLF